MRLLGIGDRLNVTAAALSEELSCDGNIVVGQSAGLD
jgi:hypothetical protein